MLEVFTREAAKASAVLCDDVWLTDTVLMAKAGASLEVETKDGLLVGGWHPVRATSTVAGAYSWSLARMARPSLR
ncbi:MAG: hypothetical protein U0163_10230 [Gemmatimonadaceae bacterium]